MDRFRWVRLSLCAALVSSCTGCLFVRHSTNMIREGEKQHQVRFDSEQSRNLFEAGAADMKAHKESTNGNVFFIPFLLWNSRMEVLSDNAIYNDQALACDTNGDGVITLAEAEVYRAKVAEKVQLAEAKARQNEAKSDSTSLAQRPADPGKPQDPPR